MKKLLLCLFLIASFFSVTAGTISLGYSSGDVLIWRFWEVGADNIPHPKVLVYNITDKPVTFLLKKTNSRGSIEPAEKALLASRFHVLNDTIVQAMTIAPHDHGVYDIVALKKSGLYDAVLVNNVYCGIMPDLQPLELEKYFCKYYSYEGVAGSMNCLICKNTLFTGRGETDSTRLLFDCAYRPYKEKSRQIEARINEGIDTMSLFIRHEHFDLTESNKRIEFTVDIENTVDFTINIVYKVSHNEVIPGINFHNNIPQHGFSTSCWLPVFIK